MSFLQKISLSLTFSDKLLEQEFRNFYLEKNIFYVRLSLVLGSILYAFFAFLDPYLTPDVYPIIWYFRGLVILFLFLPVYIISYFEDLKKFLPYLIPLVIFFTGFSIIYFSKISSSSTAHLHFVGLILLFIYAYTFSRVLIEYVNFSVIFIWGFYLASYFYNPIFGSEYFFTDIFFLTFSLICSIYAGFVIEKYDRDNFLLMKELERKNRELESLNKKLEKSSFIDYLTGLYNRRYMEIRLKEAISTYKRNKIPISIIFFDLDNFKEINDNYGHEFGDFVLKKVSELILSFLRENDVVFRYGGDEFCILLLNSDLDKSLAVGKRILKGIKTINTLSGRPLRLSFSGSCLSLSSGIDTVSEIIKRADDLLYRAKEQGKSRLLGDFS